MLAAPPSWSLLAVGVVIALMAPWSDGDEARSVDSLLQVLPRNADTFTLLDLEEVRDERLDDLEVQVAALFDTDRLYEWGIDLDDIDALLLSDLGNADALTVLQGIFSTEDVADALDDAGFRDDVYRDIEIWVDRRSDTAVALAAEDTIIIGEGERVEDSIDAFIGATRSIEQEDDVSEIVDSLGDALAYSVDGELRLPRVQEVGERSACWSPENWSPSSHSRIPGRGDSLGRRAGYR